MSKPLPPESGFPVKVVVRGSDERTAEAFRMDREMQGEIQRFTLAARQKLQGLEVGGAVKEFPQASLRFAKNNGQEQLVVVLRPPVRRSPAAQPEQPLPDRLPDYCVVDVVVPGAVDTAANFLALGVSPAEFLEQPFFDQQEFDFATTIESYGDGKAPGEALMRYSRQELGIEGFVPITDRVSSLRIDLRNIAPETEIQIELWGRYFPEPSDADGEVPLKEFETPPTELESLSGAGFRHEGEVDFHWPDGTGEPHDEQNLDPLGNPTIFSSTALSLTSRLGFPNILFNAMFEFWLNEASWDETVYTTTPNIGYRQKRFDPDTGKLLEERRFIFSGSASELSGEPCPTHGTSSTRVEWTINALEQTRLWPPPEPGEDGLERDVDVVSAFYYDSPLLEAADTANEDGAGIWAINSEIPERAMIGQAVLQGEATPTSVTFNDDSTALTKLGLLTIRRRAAEAVFEPA